MGGLKLAAWELEEDRRRQLDKVRLLVNSEARFIANRWSHAEDPRQKERWRIKQENCNAARVDLDQLGEGGAAAGEAADALLAFCEAAHRVRENSPYDKMKTTKIAEAAAAVKAVEGLKALWLRSPAGRGAR